MAKLAKQIGTKTETLALVLNGLFTNGLFLCQVVPPNLLQAGEDEPVSTPVEAPRSPYKAHETDQEYFDPSNQFGSALGANLGPDAPLKKADFLHSDLSDYVTYR